MKRDFQLKCFRLDRDQLYRKTLDVRLGVGANRVIENRATGNHDGCHITPVDLTKTWKTPFAILGSINLPQVCGWSVSIWF
jgi:hypothetical protein